MAEPSTAEEGHIQATFYTEKERLPIPSTPFSLPLSATRDDLSQLINQLLSDDEESYTETEYDFLINGSLLRKTLENLITSLQLPTTEAVIPIECVDRHPPPSLDEEFPHNDWVSAVHCNEDYIVTGCYDNIVRIWSINGDCVAQSAGHEREISGVVWVPKSHDYHVFISVSHDQHAHIWKYDGETIECVYICKGHSRIIESVDISPNGEKFCTGGVDKLIKVWSSSVVGATEGDEAAEGLVKKPRLMEDKRPPKSRVPIATFSGHTHSVMCIKWDSDGILSAGYDHCIRQWDIETGVNINTMNGSNVFLSIDKSRDSHMIASGNTDRHVRLWDTRASSSSLVTHVLSSHRGWVKQVHWSPDNNYQLASGSYDNTAKLWDLRSPKVPLYTVIAHEDKLLCLDWSISKVIVTGGCDNTLRTFTC